MGMSQGDTTGFADAKRVIAPTILTQQGNGSLQEAQNPEYLMQQRQAVAKPWTAPTLLNKNQFQSQGDVDAFKAALTPQGFGWDAGGEHATNAHPVLAQTDQNNYDSAMKWGIEQGIIPKGNIHGLPGLGSMKDFMSTWAPILAVAAPAIVGVAGAAGAGAATESGSLLANGTYDVAGPAGGAGSAVGSMGAYPGTAATAAAPAAAAGTPNGPATNPQGTAGTGAAQTPATSTADKATQLIKAVGEHATTALTVGSLLGSAIGIGGGSGATPEPTSGTQPGVLPQVEQPGTTPDAGSIAKNNTAAMGPGGSLAGNGSTFLTGPAGVDPNKLSLGKATLLGG